MQADAIQAILLFSAARHSKNHVAMGEGRAGRADIREGQHTLGVCQN